MLNVMVVEFSRSFYVIHNYWINIWYCSASIQLCIFTMLAWVGRSFSSWESISKSFIQDHCWLHWLYVLGKCYKTKSSDDVQPKKGTHIKKKNHSHCTNLPHHQSSSSPKQLAARFTRSIRHFFHSKEVTGKQLCMQINASQALLNHRKRKILNSTVDLHFHRIE